MHVTLVGADGAGKSTICQMVVKSSHIPVKYIYMGINFEASNYILPTTWLLLKFRKISGNNNYEGGPPDPKRSTAVPRNPIKRLFGNIKTGLRYTNIILEEWYRALIAWYFQTRGYLVLFDRHFFLDYHAHHIQPKNYGLHFAIRFHGYMLSRWYPKPELVIFLDAPAEVLFNRKREGTVELIEQRRQEYLNVQHLVERFEIVNVDRPVDEVAVDVIDIIINYARDSKKLTAPDSVHG